MVMPTEMDDFLFDLRGYIVLEQALSPEEVAELNANVDRLVEEQDAPGPGLPESPGYEQFGRLILNVVEAGEPFERLIDHPSWSEHLRRYIGRTDRPVLDTSAAILRPQGHASKLHSGAHKRKTRSQFRYHNGEFRCGQINIIVALNDWRSGDGVTMVVPGSHKSNFIHPAFATPAAEPGGSLDAVEGAVEVLMNAGDAVFFVDCLAHGSGKRVNPGVRRSVLYGYCSRWQTYRPDEELMERLTPERREFMNV